MFGLSEKELERQEHAEELLRIKSKAKVFRSALENALLSDKDDLVFIGQNAIKKSFIHSLSRYKHVNDSGTIVKYFNFDLSGHETMTSYFSVSDTELSFDQIKTILD